MDQYSFILFTINPLLSLPDVLNLKLTSSFINKHTINVNHKIQSVIKFDLIELFNIVVSDNAQCLKLTPNITFRLKTKLNNKIYQDFILNECDKYNSNIYNAIKVSYIEHFILKKKTFTLMCFHSSFLSYIMMFLYH